MTMYKKDYHVAQRSSAADYSLVVLLLCFSGNQAFTTGPRQEPLLLLMFAVVVFRIGQRWGGAEKRAFLWLASCLSIVLAEQAFSQHYVLLPTQAGFLVKLVVGVGIVSSVRRFRFVLVRVVVWLACLSLLIHIPTIIAGAGGVKIYEAVEPIANLVGAEPPGVQLRVNVLVHNFMDGENLFRNSGMFWEPGAFSGYLILALALLASIRFDLPEATFKRWRFYLSLAVLSTMSTSGFLLLPFVLFASRAVSLEAKGDSEGWFTWSVLFALFLLTFATFAQQFDFLGPKIQRLYQRGINREAGWQLSRFGALLFDWEHIQERPLFGWSPADPARYSLFPSLDRYATGNGLSGYVREMGIVGMMIFLFCLWRGLGRVGLQGASRLLVFSIVVLQLTGESFLSYPFYMGLQFLGLERRRGPFSPSNGALGPETAGLPGGLVVSRSGVAEDFAARV